jgi:hypothetical protein
VLGAVERVDISTDNLRDVLGLDVIGWVACIRGATFHWLTYF